MTVAYSTVQVMLALVLPPLLLGVIARTKAWFAGRRGPPLLQPYFDVLKLLRKRMVLSTTTTWVFRAGPVVTTAATMLAVAFVPLGHRPAVISFTGDFLLLAYLLALGRFFTVSAAMDTGSAFEGMGAAREALFACLAEPALFLGLLVLARLSDASSLSAMLAAPAQARWMAGGASMALVVVALFIVLLVENCRIPIDDPNTHLELTMIHEVMVLDHSGPAFGLIQYGAAVKLYLFAALLVGVAVPRSGGGAWADLAVAVAAIVGIAVLVGTVESVLARLRLLQIPSLLVAACLMPALGIVLLLR